MVDEDAHCYKGLASVRTRLFHRHYHLVLRGRKSSGPIFCASFPCLGMRGSCCPWDCCKRYSSTRTWWCAILSFVCWGDVILSWFHRAFFSLAMRGGRGGDGAVFIIFGWGRQTRRDWGPTCALSCPNCSNDKFWHLLSLTRWFTLFFIPVIPYSFKNYLVCPVCSEALELNRAQTERAKRLNGTTTSFLNDEMTEEQYLSALDAVDLFEERKAIEPPPPKKISLNCPHCDAKYSVGEQYAGKQGRCKKCGGLIVVPDRRHAATKQG